MSQTALCLAVRNVLRQAMGWSNEECDVVPPPGRPPAVCGQTFCSVWQDGVTNDATESRSDRHAVKITLTSRSTVAPYDREAEEVVHDAEVGLEVVADMVADLVHGNYDVLNEANNIICAAVGNRPTYGFSEPLRFLAATNPEKKNGDWFHGDPGERDVGLAITLRFGKAHRLQSNLYLFQGGR